MELITCEYCGTEFGADEAECPLCGTPAGQKPEPMPGKRERGRGSERSDAGREDRIPRWMWAMICCVLGLALVIGLVYFCYSMGLFKGKEPDPDQTQLQNPFEEEQPQLPGESYPEEYPEEENNEQNYTGVPCTSVTLNLTQVVLDEEGSSIFLTAVAKPNDTTDVIVYSSTDESVVTVSHTGLVTAVGPGEAEILATCGSIVERCSVKCDFEEEQPPVETDPDEDQPDEKDPDEKDPDEDQPAKEIKLSTTDFTLFSPGEKTTLKVIDAPNGANITFSSSNTKVVTVTNMGLVTAVGSGTATITVTVDDVKLTCTARCKLDGSSENNGGEAEVRPGPFRLVNEYGTEGDATLVRSGETCVLMLLDGNGEEVEGLSWSTSNSGVATVSASGKVTAVGKGQCTISTVYNGVTYKYIIRCNF